MGAGDWNDGMNRVGVEGRGESVWLAWFLCDVLQPLRRLCERPRRRRRPPTVHRQRAEPKLPRGTSKPRLGRRLVSPRLLRRRHAARLAAQRGMPDRRDRPIAGRCSAGAATRARAAGDEVGARSAGATATDTRSLLFTPPFDQTTHDPGYIKGYLPGVRENGGQYTHAAIWTAWPLPHWATASAPGALFDLLNPINQATRRKGARPTAWNPTSSAPTSTPCSPTPAAAAGPGTPARRPGCTALGWRECWGLRKRGEFLEIDPVIPAAWEGFDLTYRHGGTVYRLQVRNPEGCERGVQSMTLDGAPLPEVRIPLRDDGGEHRVEVIMGAAR